METLIYDDFTMGSDDLHTAQGFLLAGNTLAERQPVMLDVANVGLIPWDGTPGKAIGVATFDVDASNEGKRFPFYKTGTFRKDSITWPNTVTTDAVKFSAFVGTPISIDD